MALFLGLEAKGGSFTGGDRERRREAFRAETLLAKMAIFESLAQKLGDTRRRVGRVFDADAMALDRTTESYRRAIGVAPAQREELRRGLEEIRAHAHRRVVDLVAEIAAQEG